MRILSTRSFVGQLEGDCVEDDEYLETRDVTGPAGCVERPDAKLFMEGTCGSISMEV